MSDWWPANDRSIPHVHSLFCLQIKLSVGVRNHFGMTLDHLIALCDEMAALARAGVPLDRGLRDLARELPGKLGRTSGKIASELERGQDLAGYLRNHAGEFPPAFAAVVESGLRVGRLPAALEDLAKSARRLATFKRALLAAWGYPLMVMATAFCLFLFMLAGPIPVLIHAYQDVARSNNPLMDALATLRATAGWWGMLVPVLALCYLGFAWWRVHAADLTGSGLRWWSLGIAAPLVRLRRGMQLADFTHLLALLIEHLVPLPEALRLATHGSGSGLKASARRLADQLERGEAARERLIGVPPVLSWLLAHPPPAGELAPALRLLAEGYAAEVDRERDILSWYGPVVLTSLVGGATVLVYCVLVAGPWLSVLYAYIEQASS